MYKEEIEERIAFFERRLARLNPKNPKHTGEIADLNHNIESLKDAIARNDYESKAGGPKLVERDKNKKRTRNRRAVTKK